MPNSDLRVHRPKTISAVADGQTLDHLVQAKSVSSRPVKVAGFHNPFDNLPAVSAVLKKKHLLKSFTSHLKDLVRQGKPIKIGVVDIGLRDESSSQATDQRPRSTHGQRIIERIMSSAPSYLRKFIEIVRYDVTDLEGEPLAKVLKRAAQDAQNKSIVGLSLSGGTMAYPVQTFSQFLNGGVLNKASAGQAYAGFAKKYLSKSQQEAWQALADASRVIPIVTPIWNDGQTTVAALNNARSNGIVTSIMSDFGSDATPVDMVDGETPPGPLNRKTSQSAPTFLGIALGVVKLEDVPLAPQPRPGPRR